jgi:hypothetical protein
MKSGPDYDLHALPPPDEGEHWWSRISVIPMVYGTSRYRRSFVIMIMFMLAVIGHAGRSRVTMRLVPTSERESTRAKLEIEIERLRVLISGTAADIPDLETTGAYVSAALKTLDRRERAEPNETESAWGLAALDAATLQAAITLQEAIACVGLMRVRTVVMPVQSDFRDLSDRLAQADAAFRIIAVGARRSLLAARQSDRRCFFWQKLRFDWAVAR